MKLTPEKLTAFLAVLAETATVQAACDAIDVSRYTAYKWRKDAPGFAEDWDDALKAGMLRLEDEATRRATDGVDEPVFYQGSQCGSVRRYSDTLLIFLLKAHNPEKYRDNARVELAGHLSTSSLTDDEIREELAALAAAGVVAPPVAEDDATGLV